MDPRPACVAAAPERPPAAADGIELTLELAAAIAPLLHARIAGLRERAPAELSSTNLWLFRRAHGWRFHDGPWPCISGVAYDAQAHVLPLFDVGRAPARILHELLARHGCVFPITERELPAIDGACFTLTSNPDDSDYLYPADQFRHYRGRVLQKKRNLMAQLLAQHEVGAIPYTPGLQGEAAEVLEGWMRDKGKVPGASDDLPCREALALAPQLQLQGFLYRVDGTAAGFLLAEKLQPGVWVLRFAKGLVRFKGIAQFMFHHFATHAPEPVAWLNFEQDLGLANFRHTKTSYRPAALLPKWRLLPNPIG